MYQFENLCMLLSYDANSLGMPSKSNGTMTHYNSLLFAYKLPCTALERSYLGGFNWHKYFSCAQILNKILACNTVFYWFFLSILPLDWQSHNQGMLLATTSVHRRLLNFHYFPRSFVYLDHLRNRYLHHLCASVMTTLNNCEKKTCPKKMNMHIVYLFT